MNVTVQKCLHCGHTWLPRKPGRPTLCPNPRCHRANWDKPPQRVHRATSRRHVRQAISISSIKGGS